MHATGAITLPDGLYVLSKYAQLIEQQGLDELMSVVAVTHMPVVLLEEWVAHEQKNNFYINAYLSETNAVVLAPAPYKNQLFEFVTSHNGTYTQMPLYFGLFAPVAHALSETMQIYGQKIDFHAAQIPVYSPVDGNELTDAEQVRDAFFGMVQSSIRWTNNGTCARV